MPCSDKLKRCVDEVMAKGHDEASAWAICKDSVGATNDGSMVLMASICEAKEIAVDETIKKLYPGAVSIRLAGKLGDVRKNGNNWSMDENAMDEAVVDMKAGRVNFRLDHGTGTRDTVGKVVDGDRLDDRLLYAAEMTSADPSVVIPILKGYVKGASLKVIPKRGACSACGKEGLPLTCNCKDRHLVVKSLKMVEATITPEPAYTDGRATLTPLSFTAAMDALAASMSEGATSMSENEKDKGRKEPTAEELKAALEKLGYKVEKPDPLAEAKAALEAQAKELEAVKAEMEKLKAGQGQTPPPPSAPGKPASRAPPTNAEQEQGKEGELSLEAQMKQTPNDCFVSAFDQMRKAKGYDPING